MRRGSPVLLTFLVTLLALLDGCGCRKKTDEEILRARIDASPVHLWLAAKIALGTEGDPGGDPDVKAARKAIRAFVEAAQKKDAAGLATMEPEDAARMGLALWKLRGLGKEAFAKNDVAVPKPILASLLMSQGAQGKQGKQGKLGELDELLDARTEHAALLIGLTTAKVHPKLAVPVPPEILLYEAWWTDPDKVSIATARPVARAFKAYVYGTSELCDLAQRESDRIPADGEVFTGEAIAHDLELLSGTKVKPAPADTKAAGALVSTLANGATAICYFQRDEAEKATKPLRRVVESADSVGLKGEPVDFLRGYVECADGDASVGKQRLEAFIASKKISKREREAAQLLLSRCGKKGLMAKALDRATLAGVVGLIALDVLDESGAIDVLRSTSLARSIGGLAGAVGSSMDKAKTAVPSYDDTKKGVQGWFDR